MSANLIQFLSYAAMMSSFIFVPLLCKELGGNNLQIGLAVAVYNFFVFLASYVFGVASDKYGTNLFIKIGLALSCLAFGLQIFIKDIPSLIVLRGVAGFTFGIFPAALATYAFSQRGGKMGRFLSFGALGWALGSITAGLIGSYTSIFLFGAVCFLLAFSLSLKLKNTLPLLPASIFSIRIVKKNLKIYSKYLLRSLGANTIWVIFPLYLQILGADKIIIGILFFVNAFSQFVLMQSVEKFKNILLIQIGIFTSMITFAGYALSPGWIYILPLQLLLAFSFSTIQVGVSQEILSKNEEKSTVAGTLNSILNFSAMTGPIIGGILSQLFGYKSTMYFASILSLLALLI